MTSFAYCSETKAKLALRTLKKIPTFYLLRWNLDFSHAWIFNDERQNGRDWLQLAQQIISQSSFIVPRIQIANLQHNAILYKARTQWTFGNACTCCPSTVKRGIAIKVRIVCYKSRIEGSPSSSVICNRLILIVDWNRTIHVRTFWMSDSRYVRIITWSLLDSSHAVIRNSQIKWKRLLLKRWEIRLISNPSWN